METTLDKEQTSTTTKYSNITKKSNKKSVIFIVFVIYIIIVHLMLLYAVIGVTYFLYNESHETLASTSSTNTFTAVASTSSPTVAMTATPTSQPTDGSLTIINTTTNYQLIQQILATFPKWLPRGMILIWNGYLDNIPAGYAVCNGSNGTPDLQDRFVVGAGNLYSLNETGGAIHATLSPDHIPSHYHALTNVETVWSQGHIHNVGTFQVNSENVRGSSTFAGIQTNQDNGHIHDVGSYLISTEGVDNHVISGTTATGGNHRHQANKNQCGSSTQANCNYWGLGGPHNMYTQYDGTHSHTFSGAINTTHSHLLSGSSALGGSHNHQIEGTINFTSTHTHQLVGTSALAGNHYHQILGVTDSFGEAERFSLVNPYYAVFYVMKL